jgi:hypothetical protein
LLLFKGRRSWDIPRQTAPSPAMSDLPSLRRDATHSSVFGEPVIDFSPVHLA